jgi:hypothetical protein
MIAELNATKEHDKTLNLKRKLVLGWVAVDGRYKTGTGLPVSTS